MSTSTTFIGLDAHKETIVAAILYPRQRKPELVELANTEQSIRRFVRKLRQKTETQVRACYEAGPLGFGLLRQLEKLGLEEPLDPRVLEMARRAQLRARTR